MSQLDGIQFVDQAQLKQVMLANADKADKRYVKKVDMVDYTKTADLGDLAFKNKVGTDDLDAELGGIIDGLADQENVYTKDETDSLIQDALDSLGDLAAKNKVAKEDLDSALAGELDAKAVAENVYTKDETDGIVTAAIDDLGALAHLDKVAEDDLADGLKNKINDVYTKAEVYTKDETYNKDEIDNKVDNAISAVYKPGGSATLATLPEAGADNLGYVYNMTEAFVPDSNFVDGIGDRFPAGTNVVVVEVEDDVYKYDILAGFIDLSNYVQFDDIVVASSEQIQNIIDSIYEGMDSNDDPAVVDVVLNSRTSLSEIASFAKEEGVTEIHAKLNNDIVVPSRADGKISTTFISDPVDVELDLNGHDIVCDAYAMYVTNGTLTIKDDTGRGAIKTRIKDQTYPAVYCEGGKVVMESGVIDTTDVELAEGEHNYTYGLVAAKDGVIEIKGGEIHTAEASCLSICNGQASGAGAKFIVSGDARLVTDKCAAIYLADNKDLILKENVVVDGGIIARMGNIEIKDNAQIINNLEHQDDFGEYIVSSGVIAAAPAILLMTGCYKTNTESNELTLTISDDATVSSSNGEALYVARLDTLYDQTVRINVADPENLTAAAGYDKIKVADHDELAAIAAASGKTMKVKAVETDVEIIVDGEVFYDNVTE